jgi:hypothetical protein
MKWKEYRRTMAVSKIAKLSVRIEALAGRRRGKLTADMLTDDVWERMEQLTGPNNVRTRTGCEHLSDAELLHCLIESDFLTSADVIGQSATK